MLPRTMGTTVRFLHYSDVENAYDDPARIGRLASSIRELRDDATLVCGTGDTTAPGLLAMETRGAHARRFFRAVAPDFATFGNHDFDPGTDPLRETVAESPQTWVTANLLEESGDRQFAADAGVQRTALTSVDGTRVGLAGVTDPETVRPHPGAEGVRVTDPVEAAARATDELVDRGVDLVVVLSHAGESDDGIASLPAVDLVLGGHVHDVRNDRVDGTPVVHPGQRGERLSEVVVTDGAVDVVLHDVTEAEVAADVAETYRDLRTETGLDETLTRVEGTVPRDRTACYPESVMGNTVADAYRWSADADVAIFNAMQLRTGPALSGEVTVGDVRGAIPFDNPIHATTLTGEEVLELLANLGAPGPDLEVFGHVSGATLTWRRTGDDLALDSATVGGESPDPSATYRVSAPAYAFDRGLFPPLASDRVEETTGRAHEALVAHVRRHGLTDLEGRMRTSVDDAEGSLRSLD